MLKASVRAILVTALLSVAAVALQGCAYDPYTGTYVAYDYPAYGYGYYGYPYYPYGTWGYYPSGSVVIGGTWGGYHGGHYYYHR